MTEDPHGYLANRTVTVTGAGGYIASCLCRQLAQTDCTIRRITRNTAALPALTGRARIEDVEWRDNTAATCRDVVHGADIVYHLAAQTSLHSADQDPAADLAINVLITEALVDACARQGNVPTVVFSGTVTQAGMPETLPVNEDIPDRPVSVYDCHKLMAEDYLKFRSRSGSIRGVSLRLANVYGPGPKEGSGDRGILNMMIRRALNGDPLTVYGDGAFVRDYVHVHDVVAAMLAVPAHADDLCGQHFVIGSGEGHTIREAINTVAEIGEIHTGRPVKVTHVPAEPVISPIEDRNFIADTTRFTDATGWRPFYGLRDGIDMTFRALLEGTGTQ